MSSSLWTDGDALGVDHVTVEIKGQIVLPLKLQMLKGLEDPVLEEEILKEAVRVGVSERIGHFDAMKIDILRPPQSSPGKGKASRTVVRAELDVEHLALCIERIQSAYDHILQQAHVLEEVAAEISVEEITQLLAKRKEEDNNDNNNNNRDPLQENEADELISKLQAVQHIVGEMTKLPEYVTETTTGEEEEENKNKNKKRLGAPSGKGEQNSEEEEEGEEDEMKKGLLASGSEGEEEGGEERSIPSGDDSGSDSADELENEEEEDAITPDLGTPHFNERKARP